MAKRGFAQRPNKLQIVCLIATVAPICAPRSSPTSSIDIRSFLVIRFALICVLQELLAQRIGAKVVPYTSSVAPPQKLVISQSDNFAANFGEVLRSSAFFWAKSDQHVKSTICISNYWRYKNSLEVAVLVNLRTLSGRLINRIKIHFEDSEVYNYSPPDAFEGSVEVETFSIRNMRIPYAAVMAVYECSDSISMVHSYARAYSNHEIEEKRTICVGEESCWTLLDTNSISSFCAFHNGTGYVPEQRVALRIRRYDGIEKSVHFQLHSLSPYETVVIEPKSHFPGLIDWLAGRPGNARISFRLEGGFTRLLCGNRSNDWTQLQVTHSNFDYSVHDTDIVKHGIPKAYMITPTIRDKGVRQEIVVYPDTKMGEYTMTGDGGTTAFRTTQIVRKEYGDNGSKRVQFTRSDSALPTRIVTGLRLSKKKSTIPAECSMGVVHHEVPPKHFSWMVVSEQFNSTICWVDYKEVFGGCPPDAKLVFNLYSTGKKEAFKKEFNYSKLPSDGSIVLHDVFKDELQTLHSYAYLTVWCSYGGLRFFSTLEKNSSISIEHSF